VIVAVLVRRRNFNYGNLDCWIEASNEEARSKVRISFRDKIKVQQQLLEKQKKLKQEQEQQQTQMVISSTVQPPKMMPKATIDSSNNKNSIQKEDGKSSSSSTATPLISLHHNPKIKKQTKQVEEDTNHSNTSMF